MYVEGEGSQHVAAFTGRYTNTQGAVYAKACKVFCNHVDRTDDSPNTGMKRLAQNSSVVKGDIQDTYEKELKGHGTKQFRLDQRSSPTSELAVVFVAASIGAVNPWSNLLGKPIENVSSHDVVDDRVSVLRQECADVGWVGVRWEMNQCHDADRRPERSRCAGVIKVVM